jgi:ubiquinone/menaquinone biosynthesis C-methylase UbiE
MIPDSHQQQLFNDSWATYKKLLAADYMHHKLFTGLAIKEAGRLTTHGSLEILDLGCGDASYLLSFIEKLPITSYTGFDLSEVALQNANLLTNKIKVDFKLGDMLKLMEGEHRNFDLILSSYAIHHYTDAEKAILFKEISRKLKPSGCFLYIDLVREEEQSLQAYRKEYTNKVLGWNALHADEQLAVTNHINQYDYPARLSDVHRFCTEASMKVYHQAFGDKMHVFLSVRKV